MLAENRAIAVKLSWMTAVVVSVTAGFGDGSGKRTG